MLHHDGMSAFLLLIAAHAEARATAARLARQWWQRAGRRALAGPAMATDDARQYEYPEATLLCWPGRSLFRQQIDAEQVAMSLDSQGRPETDPASTSADHALIWTRQAAGTWTVHRGWHAERSVYYARHRDCLAVASSPRVLLAALGLPAREHPAAVAAFFAHRPLSAPTCFFADVHSLAPGSSLKAEPDGGLRIMATAALPRQLIVAASDADWMLALDAALKQTVMDQPGPDPVGLMLSGGIDSSTLAAALAAVQRPTRLYTWQLPMAAVDESGLAGQTAAALSLPIRIVPVDALPFADLDRLPIHPDAPLANPYRAINDALMAAAAEDGIATLLSGNFGDHLYPEPNLALSSAWRARRFRLAASAGWHKLAGRLRHGPWWPRSWQHAEPAASPLTEAARQWLADTAPAARPEIDVEDPSRLADLFDSAARLDAEGAWYFASGFPLELRFPYRHTAMLELALQWPVHVSERHSLRKWLTRQWLRGRIPEAIRTRPKAGSLAPWFWRGLAVHRDEVRARLFNKNASWSRYLRPEPVLACLQQAGSESAGLHVWQAVCYEIWHEAAIRDGTLR